MNPLGFVMAVGLTITIIMLAALGVTLATDDGPDCQPVKGVRHAVVSK